MQIDIFINKSKNTKKELYDDENFTNREKAKETCLTRYGYDNILKVPEFIRKREETRYKNWLEKIKDIDLFKKYYKEVWHETRKWIKKLYETWDGLCYYTRQKLISTKEYKKLNPKQHPNSNVLLPSIDHKISILFGYLNKISPEVIGNINNLVICSKHYNSFKNHRTEEEQLIYHMNKLLEG
jgi:hypothetical protein